MGPRYNPKKPDMIKIVTKQYPTFLENYFKGMETIKELYIEALRAPADPVNLIRDPYVREKFMKKRFGRTRAERIQSLKGFNRAHSLRKHEYNLRMADEKMVEEAEQVKRVENQKIRRKLGFIDYKTDADGNIIEVADGEGVDDQVMDEFNINDARYQKKVQETRARKKIDIVTPVQGVGR